MGFVMEAWWRGPDFGSNFDGFDLVPISVMLLDWCGLGLILLGFVIHLWVFFGSDFGDIVGLV